MKVLEKPITVTTCACCGSKLELTPEDMSPVEITCTFRGKFVCPVCKYENYLTKKGDICI